MRRFCKNVPDGWSKWDVKDLQVQQSWFIFLSLWAKGNWLGRCGSSSYCFNNRSYSLGKPALSLRNIYNLTISSRNTENVSGSMLKLTFSWMNGFALAVAAPAWLGVNHRGHVKACRSEVRDIPASSDFLLCLSGCWALYACVGSEVWLLAVFFASTLDFAASSASLASLSED